MCGYGSFFSSTCFGNGTCTLGGDSGKSVVICCTLGGGRRWIIGSGTAVGCTLRSVGGWITCFGYTVGVVRE